MSSSHCINLIGPNTELGIEVGDANSAALFCKSDADYANDSPDAKFNHDILWIHKTVRQFAAHLLS